MRTAELRGTAPPLARILAIGDALRTDLAAAQGLGVDALFIAAGIHKEVMANGAIDAARLAALFAPPDAPPAIAAMPQLRW
jgi:ribonucleotide monophosphatase NagD (HAD superfamily)